MSRYLVCLIFTAALFGLSDFSSQSLTIKGRTSSPFLSFILKDAGPFHVGPREQGRAASR